VTAWFDGETYAQMEKRKAAEKSAFEARWKRDQERMTEYMTNNSEPIRFPVPWLLPPRWNSHGRPEFAKDGGWGLTWQAAMNDMVETVNELHQRIADLEYRLSGEDE
jgi:hypothetical protein